MRVVETLTTPTEKEILFMHCEKRQNNDTAVFVTMQLTSGIHGNEKRVKKYYCETLRVLELSLYITTHTGCFFSRLIKMKTSRIKYQ